MSKAFTRESDSEDDDLDLAPSAEIEIAPGAKNYITPAGYQRLKDEFAELWEVERPKLVDIIAWAAGNGDRSENGDYQYGKKRLREVDRRIRFLSKRLEHAEVVDNTGQDHDRVFFGATVTYENSRGEEHTVTIVGIDEADLDRGRISWISPVARALLKAEVGDVVELRTPGARESLEVIAICYPDAGS